MTVKFEFYNQTEFVLDRFPDAKINPLDKSTPLKDNFWLQYFSPHLIEIKLDLNIGTMMWFLSQGPWLKILSPQPLIDMIAYFAKLTSKMEPVRKDITKQELDELWKKYGSPSGLKNC